MGLGPPDMAGKVGEDIQRAVIVALGLVVAAQPGAGDAQAVVRVRLAGPVADPLGGGQRGQLGPLLVVHMAVAVESR